MHKSFIYALALFGTGVASAEKPSPEANPAIEILVNPKGKTQHTVRITDVNFEGDGDEACWVYMAISPGEQKGEYETAVNSNANCESTAKAAASWTFSPSQSWIDRSQPRYIQFQFKIQPKEAEKKILIPSDLLANDQTLPAVAQAVEVELPAAKRRVSPTYPAKMKSNGVEAICSLQFFLDEKGTPQDIKVEDCPEAFQASASKAGYKWRFSPMMEDGKSVPSLFRTYFAFKID